MFTQADDNLNQDQQTVEPRTSRGMAWHTLESTPPAVATYVGDIEEEDWLIQRKPNS